MLTLTDADFDEAVTGNNILVVDFWAEWCAPCKAIAPALDEFAQKYEGKIRFGKVNADENPAVMMRLGIMGLPTIVIFKGGKLVDTIVGAKPKAMMEKSITRHLTL